MTDRVEAVKAEYDVDGAQERVNRMVRESGGTFPECTVGEAILNRVAELIGKYVVFPDEHALTAVTLWAAHTHAPLDTFYVTPRLVLDSAEPGSGKTRVIELLNLLVHQPEMTISATVAAIFRMLDANQHTLLFDEVDAIFNPKNGGNYEDLRALLNAGYKQGATIARCVGDAKNMKVQRFKVFAPVALAGLVGKMPATITTRAVTIHMRKRAPGEKITPFRERDVIDTSETLRADLHEWVAGQADDLAKARPELPEGVVDRPAEVWEALVAVADAAGGTWPERARKACESFVLGRKTEKLSIGVQLLKDIKAIFTKNEVNRMRSADIVTKLAAHPERPWAVIERGGPITERRLSDELARYDVRPESLKFEKSTLRGYDTYKSGLQDAWTRYLQDPAKTAKTAATEQLSMVVDEVAVADEGATTGSAVADGCTDQKDATTVLTCEGAPVAAVVRKTCRSCQEDNVMLIREGRDVCERCRLEPPGDDIGPFEEPTEKIKAYLNDEVDLTLDELFEELKQTPNALRWIYGELGSWLESTPGRDAS